MGISQDQFGKSICNYIGMIHFNDYYDKQINDLINLDYTGPFNKISFLSKQIIFKEALRLIIEHYDIKLHADNPITSSINAPPGLSEKIRRMDVEESLHKIKNSEMELPKVAVLSVLSKVFENSFELGVQYPLLDCYVDTGDIYIKIEDKFGDERVMRSMLFIVGFTI
jgi:hypothetical protein